MYEVVVIYLSVGIPIPDPFSQSRDWGISNPGIPAGLWDPGGMIPKTVILDYNGPILLNLRLLSQSHRPIL